MNEFEHYIEARPAADREVPDLRRLEVAARRFTELITGAITAAGTGQTEIDDGTARCIAHVLGRAFGRDSQLAAFGRTGEGTYLGMRDEYLALYADERVDATTKEWIDWFGTYLVYRENTGSGRRFMNEYRPPKLDRLLVATEILIHGQPFTIHLPASLDNEQIDGIREELATLQLDQDEALQAFLSLPDVDANTPMLMESFHENFVNTFENLEDAVRGLCELDEWENEVNEFAAERGLFIDQYAVDYEALRDRLSEIYDLVEWEGRVHVFAK